MGGVLAGRLSACLAESLGDFSPARETGDCGSVFRQGVSCLDPGDAGFETDADLRVPVKVPVLLACDPRPPPCRVELPARPGDVAELLARLPDKPEPAGEATALVVWPRDLACTDFPPRPEFAGDTLPLTTAWTPPSTLRPGGTTLRLLPIILPEQLDLHGPALRHDNGEAPETNGS